MENLEVLDGRSVLLWDSSAVRIHDPVLRDSNPGPISLAREHLTTRPLSRHPMVLMSNFNKSTKLSNHSLMSSVISYLPTDLVEFHWSQLLTRTPGNYLLKSVTSEHMIIIKRSFLQISVFS